MKYNFDEIIDRRNTFSLKTEFPDIDQDVLSLWVADMDLACAKPILDALHRRIDQRIFGYTITDNDAVKQAIVNWFSRRYDWEIDPCTIMFSPGVVSAISFLINILSEEGDGIIIQSPVYYPFSKILNANNRTIVDNPLIYADGKYQMNFDDLQEKLSLNMSKGLILCSPHNPVGRVWTEDELRKVVELCKKYDKWIICDEIHCDLTRIGITHHPILKVAPEYKDRIIACTAPSKTFNLAGMQISGIIIPNEQYRKKWKHLCNESHFIGMANPMSITALIAAYNECEDWLDAIRAYIDENMNYIQEFLKQNLPKAHMVFPEGTYLVWLDLNGYCSDHKVLEKLMRTKAKIFLDEGYIFGDSGSCFERINVASPKSVIVECMKRMKALLDTL